MARVSPKDRLQPSLLDRLTDDDPNRQRESSDRQVLDLRALRQSVLRDVAWLLNTGNLDSIDDLEDFPMVSESVLNYGVSHLAGSQASKIQARDMERMIQEAIWRFEPRILRDSVKVKLDVTEGSMSHNAVTFFIEGMLWAEPTPMHLFLRTEVDLEIAAFSVVEQTGRA